MTVKTQEELIDLFAPNQQQAITAESHQDLIDSTMNVGGVASTDPTPATATVMSGDTFTIDPGYDGLYSIAVQANVTIDKLTNAEIEITRNGVGIGFSNDRDFQAGVPKNIATGGAAELVEGDVIGITLLADNPAAVVTPNEVNIYMKR